MSVFIVSDRHIDALVWAGEEFQLLSCTTPDKFGRELLKTNHASYADRYMDTMGPGDYDHYRYRRPLQPPSMVGLLKAIQCYEYQARGARWYSESEAKNYCEQLTQAAIERLPGYSESAWEIK